MKTFKSLAGIVCLATAAFASVPAQAGITVNGISLNGINFNGLTLNGINFNGITVNGICPNGITINGTAATGIDAGTPVAVTLPEAVAAE